MKDSVREIFPSFSIKYEGSVAWMYADVLGLVTTGIGNLIDPVAYALPLPWQRADGSAANHDEIEKEWQLVKGDPYAAKRGYLYTKGITHLRLTAEGIQSVVMAKADQMDAYLARRFEDWESYPADAQLAILSLSWACGPAWHFPLLEKAVRETSWDDAALNCTIKEAGNPGVIPRNVANRKLYSNASRVQAYGLDPDTLVWPATLDDNAASLPTIGPKA